LRFQAAKCVHPPRFKGLKAPCKRLWPRVDEIAGHFDSFFTHSGFLRKMAFSYAAPSPECRCFVRLGLA
jgi:hypothetical protein